VPGLFVVHVEDTMLAWFVPPVVVPAMLVRRRVAAAAFGKSVSLSLTGAAVRGKTPMRIFIFKSETSPDLRAFSDDQGGHKLPAKFRPWHAIGVVRPESAPPHNLNRDLIEASITSTGFQLWRMKK
jgi:hypothetical protein